MISTYSLNSKLTEPILLPHPTTLYPKPFKYLTAISTYFDYLLPNVI